MQLDECYVFEKFNSLSVPLFHAVQPVTSNSTCLPLRYVMRCSERRFFCANFNFFSSLCIAGKETFFFWFLRVSEIRPRFRSGHLPAFRLPDHCARAYHRTCYLWRRRPELQWQFIASHERASGSENGFRVTFHAAESRAVPPAWRAAERKVLHLLFESAPSRETAAEVRRRHSSFS